MNNFSDQIVARLAEAGIRQVFGVPGGGNMFLLKAFNDNPYISIQFCHHEQAAAISCEAYCKASGEPAICLVTSGPGGTNALTGVVGAFLDSTPLVLIAGQVKTSDLKSEGLRQKGPQEVDLLSIIEPVTIASKQLESNSLPDVDILFEHLNDRRGGPIALLVPLDIQNSPLWEGDVSLLSSGKEIGGPTPEDSVQIAQMTRAFSESKRPAVLMGNGCRNISPYQLNVWFQLLRENGVGVLFSWLSYDLLPYEDDMNMGRPGGVSLRHSNLILQSADFLLVLGSRLDSTQTAFNAEGFARNASVWVVDVDKHELQKHPMSYKKIQSDVIFVLDEMTSSDLLAGTPQLREGWTAFCSDLKNRFATEGIPAPKRERLPVEAIVDVLSEMLESNAMIVTGSSGLAVEIFHVRFRNRDGQRIFLTTALGSMGYGLPAVIGAACHIDPQLPLYLFESDGSFMMNLQELSTLRAIDRPVVIFLVNNGGYASIRASQKKHFGINVGTDPDTGLMFPDFSQIAAAHDIAHLTVSTESELVDAVNAVKAKHKKFIVEIMADHNSVLEPKCSVAIAGDKFGTSQLEHLDPPLPAGEVDRILAAAMAL